MSQVLQHVIEAIGPASQANAEAVRMRVAQANAPVLERLAASLAGAQHTPRPRSAKRLIVVVAGDHGCGDPGIAMGADHPTVVAAHAIADGTAALCQVARSSGSSAQSASTSSAQSAGTSSAQSASTSSAQSASTSSAQSAGTSAAQSVGAVGTPIVLVDAGSREPSHMPDIAIQLGRGPSHDLMRGPAMTIVDAALGLDAGIALSVSLSEQSPDVLALGAIGVGSEVASAAILSAITGQPPSTLRDNIAEAAGIRGMALRGASPLEILATFGGSDTAVLAGLILGSASMNVPVILDSYATGAAALIAAAFAPPVTGYLIAAHRGSFTHPAIVEHLLLTPAFDVGLGHGEGTGAAMVLPLLDQVTALAER